MCKFFRNIWPESLYDRKYAWKEWREKGQKDARIVILARYNHFFVTFERTIWTTRYEVVRAVTVDNAVEIANGDDVVAIMANVVEPDYFLLVPSLAVAGIVPRKLLITAQLPSGREVEPSISHCQKYNCYFAVPMLAIPNEHVYKSIEYELKNHYKNSGQE